MAKRRNRDPRTVIGYRSLDGLRLIYPGREHAVIGETESGKTWFALGCVAAELVAGNHVVYIHYEEGNPGSTIERLQLLGVDAAMITQLLRFVAPRRPAQADWINALLDPGTDPGRPGRRQRGNVSARRGHHGRRWRCDVPAQARDAFLRAGAASIACDHLLKDRDARCRDAHGSVHKGNALNGARILLENVEPFGHGLRGVSYVFVTKDRPGYLRANGQPTKTL